MSAHAYLPPPDRCERLADILPQFGGTREFLGQPEAGETRGDYPLPTHTSAEVRTFLKPFSTVDPEPDFIACLPGGRVFGPGVVLSPDGRSLARDVSVDFGKPFEEHWLRSYAKIRPPVRVNGATAVAAVTLGAGYCHWLLEELPRLLILNREHHDAALIAHTEAPFIREALDFGKFPGRFLKAGRYSHFECEQLIIPGLVGRSGRPTPRMVRLLTEFTAPLRKPGIKLGERLYITREKAGRRQVTNETELWRCLEVRGFTKVRPEELSWAEQLNAFAQAKVIVAPHGAGLANLVFCQPGVRVVEFFNRSYVNPCFWQLAGVKGLDYRPVVSISDETITCDLRANRANICANITAIMDALIEI